MESRSDQRMTKLQLAILGTADSVKLLFGTVCGMERLKQLGLDRQVRTWSVAMRGRLVSSWILTPCQPHGVDVRNLSIPVGNTTES